MIAERVRAGLRNKMAKGTKLGRPRMVVEVAQIVRLRRQEFTIREIAEEMGISRSLIHKTLAIARGGAL